MKITGTVWKFPQDDINTDLIRRKMYAHLPVKEQAAHCLEQLDAAFGPNVKPGDIVVAGKNFGCGSSTPVHLALLGLGVGAVMAESFGRIFFRSSISGGLLVIASPGILDLVSGGDAIEVDVKSGETHNLTTGRTLKTPPLPQFLREMVELGGEKPYIKARLAREQGALS
jgi:3-isopropylmalate/(R)-2-methylmalate dehydratase small subunit